MPNNIRSKNPNDWGKQRNWCFTINNYRDEPAIQKWLTDNCKYALYGREVGEKCGTPHLQGYCEFENKRVYKGISKAMENATVFPRCGTQEQATVYCEKDKDTWEHGTKSAQGKRNDLTEVREALDEGMGIRQIVRQGVAKNYQGIRMAEKLLEIFEPPREGRPIVHWWHGSTGTGKSYAARKAALALFAHDDIYYANANGKWFNGYDRHPAVIINDLRYDWKKFADLLMFLDENPYRVETKGGMRQFVATHIWITCPRKPADEYKYTCDEDLEQLISRCRSVRLFDGPNRRITAMREEAKAEGAKATPLPPSCSDGVPVGPEVSGPEVGEGIIQSDKPTAPLYVSDDDF